MLLAHSTDAKPNQGDTATRMPTLMAAATRTPTQTPTFRPGATPSPTPPPYPTATFGPPIARGIYHYHYNHLGSVLAVTDENGAGVASIRYKPYGEVRHYDSSGTLEAIVWPETVLRVYLRHDAPYRARAIDLVRRLHVPLFLGSLDLPADRPGELNSGYLIQDGLATATQHSRLSTQRSLSMQVYHKRMLLPFGEYVPGASWVPVLRRWRTTGRFVGAEASHALTLTPSTSSGQALARRERGPEGEHNSRAAFTSGAVEGPHPHPLPQGEGSGGRARLTTSFAPSICFEAIRPGVFNQLVGDGAQFLINITDDGWFGDTAAPYQHLNAATLRAVETRRWLVRASNSGVSAFVDPTGEIVGSLPLGAVGVLRRRITTSNAVPLYVRWGNWIIPLCALVVALCFGSILRRQAHSGLLLRPVTLRVPDVVQRRLLDVCQLLWAQ